MRFQNIGTRSHPSNGQSRKKVPRIPGYQSIKFQPHQSAGCRARGSGRFGGWPTQRSASANRTPISAKAEAKPRVSQRTTVGREITCVRTCAASSP